MTDLKTDLHPDLQTPTILPERRAADVRDFSEVLHVLAPCAPDFGSPAMLSALLLLGLNGALIMAITALEALGQADLLQPGLTIASNIAAVLFMVLALSVSLSLLLRGAAQRRQDGVRFTQTGAVKPVKYRILLGQSDTDTLLRLHGAEQRTPGGMVTLRWPNGGERSLLLAEVSDLRVPAARRRG